MRAERVLYSILTKEEKMEKRGRGVGDVGGRGEEKGRIRYKKKRKGSRESLFIVFFIKWRG